MALGIRKVKTGTEKVVDKATGELLEENDLYIDRIVGDEKEWFQGFRALIRAVLNLDGNEVKVLLWCAIEAHVGTNEVVLLRIIKERMAAEIGLSMGGIDNALGRLVKKGHLHRLGRGVYHLDPNTTWRGSLEARAKQVNVFLRYKITRP